MPNQKARRKQHAKPSPCQFTPHWVGFATDCQQGRNPAPACSTLVSPYALHIRYIKFHGMKSREELAPAEAKMELIQELLGHNDVSTTMIYTHVLRAGGGGTKSPLDCL